MWRGEIDRTLTAPQVIVTLEPTLMMAPEPDRRTKRKTRKGNLDAFYERAMEYEFNQGMVRWINQQAYMHSISVAVWGMYMDRRLFDVLVPRIEEVIGSAVADYACFNDHWTAYTVYMSTPGIQTVYDADHDRVEELWGMRGHRVPLGGTP